MRHAATDLSILEQLFKGDREQIHQWLELYLEQAPDQFAALSEFQKAGNAEALAMIVHDLRPQTHYLGAHRMLELLVALGELVKREGTAPCRVLVDETHALSREIETELRACVCPAWAKNATAR